MVHVWSFRKIVVVFSFALGTLLAGCGSGSTASDESAPLTRAEYLKQGNAICKKGGEEKDQAVKEGLEEIPPKELGEGSPKTLKQLAEKVMPVVQNTMTELAELQPPTKEEAAVEDFIAKFEAAVAKAEANPVLIAQSDPFRIAAQDARTYGLKECTL